MRIVYQTKLSGVLETPTLDDYSVTAMKFAALGEGRTFFKGNMMKDAFRETFSLLKRAGATVSQGIGGVSVDGAKDPKAALKVIFGDEIAEFKNIILNSNKNFRATGEKDAEEDLEAAEGNDAAEEADEPADFDTTLAEYVFSLDHLYLNGAATEAQLTAILAGNAVYKNKQTIHMELPLENEDRFLIDAAAAGSLGVEAGLITSDVAYVSGENGFRHDCVITPAGDWRVAVFGLCCSAIGYDVRVSNVFAGSPFTKTEEFVKPLSHMRLILSDGFDGEARFTGSEFKTPTVIDAQVARECLPYIVFLATQTEGTTEIINVTDETLAMNNNTFYYTVAELRKLGAVFETRKKGSMFVRGRTVFEGGVGFNCHENFTLASVGILATLCSRKSNVLGYVDCVEKTCPGFWRLFESIGGFSE
ncbi:MAG: hypothetical protein J6U38_00375 [Clostridia bacterium]|nr:hypothetical protein [Clostridia bacterium]MBO7398964.1 hypothetical protein [Clostridia bacterium]MBO7502798.1 hypothetical protein [Clostridia bacterium]MBR5006506.1 hypothetical protein [Clostridia bacterium]